MMASRKEIVTISTDIFGVKHILGMNCSSEDTPVHLITLILAVIWFGAELGFLLYKCNLVNLIVVDYWFGFILILKIFIIVSRFIRPDYRFAWIISEILLFSWFLVYSWGVVGPMIKSVSKYNLMEQVLSMKICTDDCFMCNFTNVDSIVGLITGLFLYVVKLFQICF